MKFPSVETLVKLIHMVNRPALDNQIEENLAAHRELLEAHPELEAEEREDAEMEGLRAQRTALTKMLGNGVISDQIYEELVADVDAALNRGRS